MAYHINRIIIFKFDNLILIPINLDLKIIFERPEMSLYNMKINNEKYPHSNYRFWMHMRDYGWFFHKYRHMSSRAWQICTSFSRSKNQRKRHGNESIIIKPQKKLGITQTMNFGLTCIHFCVQLIIST